MTTDQRLERIERLLRDLIKVSSKKTWVNSSWVMHVTGFTKEQMRSARMQGIIEFKHSKTQTYQYLLESIPEVFLIKKTWPNEPA